MIAQVNEKPKNWMKIITFMFVVSLATTLFAMGVIRGKCISKGYELSKMAGEIESRRIALERVEQERATLVSKERLFPIAKKKGFIMMQEGKTFNVQ